MVRRLVKIWLFLGLLGALVPLTALAVSPAFNDPSFKTTWERVDKPVQDAGGTGRGYTWGPAVLGSEKVTSEAYNGGTRKVEYFDKARMEVNDPNGNPNDLFYVTTGLLVKELVTGKRQDGDNSFSFVGSSHVQIAGDSNENGANAIAPTYSSFKDVGTFFSTENGTARAEDSIVASRIDKAGQVTGFTPPEQRLLKGYDTVTQHNVADVFTDYGNLQGTIWNGQSYVPGAVFFGNSLYVLGRPVTEPYWTRAVVAGTEQDVLVQLFERRVLTYTPGNPDGFKVEMGNVGQHYFRWRYEQHTPQLLATSQSINFGTIAGNYAFWESYDYNTKLYSLNGFDLTRQTAFTIGQDSGAFGSPVSDGKIVVWVQTTSGKPQSIEGYDLATGKQSEIVKGNGSGQYNYLNLDGGNLYYQIWNDDKAEGIYSRDLSTGKETFLTKYGNNPVVKDGLLVWETNKNTSSGDHPSFQTSLHYFKTDGSQPDTVFYTTPLDNPYPYLNGVHISGSKIVWAMDPPDTRKLFIYDLTTNQTQSIQTIYRLANPIISGDLICLSTYPDSYIPYWSARLFSQRDNMDIEVAKNDKGLSVLGFVNGKGLLYATPAGGDSQQFNLYFEPLTK